MKNIKYAIGKKTFSLENDAEKKLDYYRGSIADHFSGQDTEDAIQDIDLAIIEKLESKLERRADKKVLLSDIEEVIRQLGTVEQITDQPEIDREPIVITKKLYRDMENRWIGGVCAGLAAYFAVPIWVTRLAFIIAIPAPIPSIIPYLILWYIVPPTQNKADQLQMHGIPVNLGSLSNTSGYTRKKVIGLAKWCGIILGILSLLLAAMMGAALITFLISL